VKGANTLKRWPVLILVATIWLAGSLLGACGGPANQVPPPTPEPTGRAGGVTVVDALGRTTEFPEPPQRIVVAGKSSLTIMDTLYLFAAARNRVVGLVVGNQKPGDFLSFVDPTFEKKAVLEVDAGPEQIAPLEPDVVILRSFMAEQLGKLLEQLDIPVVYVDLETPEQYFRDLSTLGQLLDDKVRASDIQAYYRSHLDYVDDSLEGLKEGQKPSILILQYSDQGGEVALNVPSATWLQTIEAELAGGVPIWKEAAQGGGWTVVNFEQIAAWDPDTIFVIHYRSDPAEIVDRLRANPQWQALRAVQEGQIYGFAGDIFSWDQPDPRWILGVTWLAGKLHPNRLSGLDMTEEIADFFGQMYGLDEATIAEKILPSLKGDIQ
jgi:iron complex transport system substrate-binding protein